MVILNMNLEVFGKMVDALTEKRNLHFGRACVRLMNPELLDDCLFLRFSNSHILRSFSLFPSLVAKSLTQRPDIVKQVDVQLLGRTTSSPSTTPRSEERRVGKEC